MLLHWQQRKRARSLEEFRSQNTSSVSSVSFNSVSQDVFYHMLSYCDVETWHTDLAHICKATAHHIANIDLEGKVYQDAVNLQRLQRLLLTSSFRVMIKTLEIVPAQWTRVTGVCRVFGNRRVLRLDRNQYIPTRLPLNTCAECDKRAAPLEIRRFQVTSDHLQDRSFQWLQAAKRISVQGQEGQVILCKCCAWTICCIDPGDLIVRGVVLETRINRLCT